jgi:hypothetical protein
MRMFVDTDTRGSRADVCYIYQTPSLLSRYLTIFDIYEIRARACMWNAGLVSVSTPACPHSPSRGHHLILLLSKKGQGRLDVGFCTWSITYSHVMFFFAANSRA